MIKITETTLKSFIERQLFRKGSKKPTPRPRRGTLATPMAANGALVHEDR